MTRAKPIYLDHAAATPLDETVLQAMQPYLKEQFYNPSATYYAARSTRSALENARAQTAYWLGSKPSEVTFTAGGTEANNLAVHGVMRRYPKANIVVSSIEHESVLAPAKKYQCRYVKVQPSGRLDLTDLESKIDENTVMVSIGYANNEIGTVQDLKAVAKIISQKRSQQSDNRSLPLYLHTDACQAANYLDLHAARLRVDLMSLNGGKIYGPKQSGVLYIKAGISLEPLIDGGGQEHGLRSGSENVAACVGFAAALDQTQTNRQTEARRLKAISASAAELLSTKLPNASINGSLKHRLPNNIHITLPGQDNERILFKLEDAGILAAAGSACSASSQTPSHVLRAIGLTDDEAHASIRLSMGRSTTTAMLAQTVNVLRSLI